MKSTYYCVIALILALFMVCGCQDSANPINPKIINHQVRLEAYCQNLGYGQSFSVSWNVDSKTGNSTPAYFICEKGSTISITVKITTHQWNGQPQNGVAFAYIYVDGNASPWKQISTSSTLTIDAIIP